ncbi:MAG TPA: tryptophan synthase subunit alpha [Pirellulales bacterium]|jgi:tryptophan synthase alpha chain|nr:tryptophan synthase subunit alpha [Pirellulales bacterium]
MSAIDDLFQKLRREKRKALMPFVTAGDPDLEFTAAVLQEFARRGCSLCEVGIPYSDPIADGPVIQESYTRALTHKIKLAEIAQCLSGVTPKVSIPLVTMVSYAIVYRHGLERYVNDMQQAGIAGAIVPDLLVEESAPLAKICRQADFSLIQLITPTTPKERAVRIAEASTGFIYYVSVTGITGERRELPPDLLDNVAWLREQTPLPVCIGFGISTPEHVRVLAPVADGLIVGSAIVRRIAAASSQPKPAGLTDVGEYVGSLLAAIQ